MQLKNAARKIMDIDFIIWLNRVSISVIGYT